uniref:Translation initiation factor IF-2, chloroplastic n=1 Tax=Hommersandiophycus borowitzkae TaxID=268573 RepID=A0A1G4NUI6_9FLOR|nr:Translation initiation factor 2 [Hommersandiophycus borowitzkae]SCW22169.1 Translation initiation factor 2 [Hommersandiophycus borowitzkae]
MNVNKDSQSSWLNLDNPKLIHYEQANVSSSTETIHNISDVLVPDMSNLVNSRSEKKSKYYNNLIDPLEVKKNKAKIKKKVRSKIHISDEDDSLDSQYHSIRKMGENLEVSLRRPPKPIKKKVHRKNHLVNIDKSQNEAVELTNHNILNDGIKKVETIVLTNPMSIQELATLISIPAPDIIKYLFLQGISVTINQVIDVEMAREIATNYSIEFSTKDRDDHNHIVQDEQNTKNQQEFDQYTEDRAPIVTIFGHVDHGKTTLMDAIAKTNNANIESGGITQAIVAHEVYLSDADNKRKIIFLDTPGHEAFSDMRIRSIQITDIAILVVAADDGLQLQSKEAIQYFKDHQLPFIVAINKIDKNKQNIDNIKQELAQYDILAEEWGGEKIIIEVSALHNKNIDKLLLAIFQINNAQILKANPSIAAEGTVLDAYLDIKQGPVAKLLVQNGTMKVGNYLLSNDIVSKVRAITKKNNHRIEEAGPSSIINVYGMESILSAGNSFKVINDEKLAKKQLSDYQKNKDKYTKHYRKLNTRFNVDPVNKDRSSLKTQIINLILKTDSEGTIDAIINAFLKIPQEKVQINLVAAGVGQITVGDINLAIVSQAKIVSFHEIPTHIKNLASQSNVLVASFNVIYDLLDYVRDLMIELVPIEYVEKNIGKALVENTFAVSKGIVAGCTVIEGKLKQGSNIKVIRNKDTVYIGEITSLKRIKEDVNEVIAGNECGVMSANFSLWQHKDMIESYDLLEQEKTL